MPLLARAFLSPAMAVGVGLWLLEFVGVVELPMAAIAAAASLATYFVLERVLRSVAQEPDAALG